MDFDLLAAAEWMFCLVRLENHGGLSSSCSGFSDMGGRSPRHEQASQLLPEAQPLRGVEPCKQQVVIE